MNVSEQPVRTHGAIMNIRAASESYAFNGVNYKIEALNSLFQLCAPHIIENGGRITRISEEGIASVFENGTESAVRAAFAFFGNASRVPGDNMSSLYSIGIHSGNVYTLNMRYDALSVPVSMSDGIVLARHLSEIAREYEARILITHTASEQLRSFENRFSSRKLGIIHNSVTGEDEVIYDLFDSDNTNQKYSKRRSKLVFETGVESFLQGRYIQSRGSFIELLKFDRNDRTAKKYIFMCDKALSGDIDDENHKYIDIW